MSLDTRTVICDNGSGFIKLALPLFPLFSVFHLEEGSKAKRAADSPAALHAGLTSTQPASATDPAEVAVDGPDTIFPNIIGSVRSRSLFYSAQYQDDAPYIGKRALANHYMLNLDRPIKRGIITDFEKMESVWEHTFLKELEIDPSEYDVIITEAANSHRRQTEKMVEIMFEKFEFRSVLVARPPVLSMYSVNRLTGVAVEIGESLTQVLPVNNGVCIPLGLQVEEVGGSDITDDLMNLLGKQAHELTMTHRREDINGIKEMLGYVAQDFAEESRAVQQETYLLPDGLQVRLASEKYICGERFFRLHGDGSKVGIHNLILQSIYRTPCIALNPDLLNVMKRNVVLGGGSTLFRGLAQRLTREMEDTMTDKEGKMMVYEGRGGRSAMIGGRMLSFCHDFREVTFGVLFNDEKCENMFEALVGTLMAARRRQILTFEGERLLDIHHHKVVIELKPTHPTPPAAH
ncbi:Actin-related protein [Cynara cardunculus var. scolymus]|uniref:Actin-related protein n=1 Tax=Cynara cardunculus var. scolymus TaxID=59895 RepID=A0A103XJX7_CYNCS|nr:Actin-related protein [Cynara cardunculus var. scolymus]